MALKAIDRSKLPTRSAGQTSIPEAEQAQLLELITSGQSASDGLAYPDQKSAAKAAGPYRRFLRRMVKAGTVIGGVRLVTFPTGKNDEQVGWAVYVDPDAKAPQGDEAEAEEDQPAE